MDKYDLVLDIIEHPGDYTTGQLQDILSDSEAKEIYTLLCKTGDAVRRVDEPDVDAEWDAFSQSHPLPRRHYLWRGSRAATVAAIVGMSLVAVAAGIAFTVALTVTKPVHAGGEVTVTSSDMSVAADSLAAGEDTLKVNPTPVMFENEPLENIMKEVAAAYGIEVKFNNRQAAMLHLYYKFDPTLSLNEIVEQLNTFEQIDIRRSGDILIID